MKKSLAILFALGLVFGACGGDSKAVEDRLLTAEDVPSTFEKTDNDDEDDSEFCEALDNIFGGTETAKAKAKDSAEVTFELDDDNSYASVGNIVLEFDSEDEAAGIIKEANDALDTCEPLDEVDDSDGSTTHAEATSLAFKKLGDETFAAKVAATISGDDDADPSTPDAVIAFEGALVAVRKGKLISAFALVGVGDEVMTQTDWEKYAEAGANKL